jgi:hypothetical protein
MLAAADFAGVTYVEDGSLRRTFPT